MLPHAYTQVYKYEIYVFMNKCHKNEEHSLAILNMRSKNQYVLWFASSFLEEIVRKKWNELSDADRSRLTQFVIEQLLTNESTLPPFVFNKLAVGTLIHSLILLVESKEG